MGNETSTPAIAAHVRTRTDTRIMSTDLPSAPVETPVIDSMQSVRLPTVPLADEACETEYGPATVTKRVSNPSFIVPESTVPCESSSTVSSETPPVNVLSHSFELSSKADPSTNSGSSSTVPVNTTVENTVLPNDLPTVSSSFPQPCICPPSPKPAHEPTTVPSDEPTTVPSRPSSPTVATISNHFINRNESSSVDLNSTFTSNNSAYFDAESGPEPENSSHLTDVNITDDEDALKMNIDYLYVPTRAKEDPNGPKICLGLWRPAELETDLEECIYSRDYVLSLCSAASPFDELKITNLTCTIGVNSTYPTRDTFVPRRKEKVVKKKKKEPKTSQSSSLESPSQSSSTKELGADVEPRRIDHPRRVDEFIRKNSDPDMPASLVSPKIVRYYNDKTEFKGSDKLRQIEEWYELGFFENGTWFAFDDGQEWFTLSTLRQMNGTACPFSFVSNSLYLENEKKELEALLKRLDDLIERIQKTNVRSDELRQRLDATNKERERILVELTKYLPPTSNHYAQTDIKLIQSVMNRLKAKDTSPDSATPPPPPPPSRPARAFDLSTVDPFALLRFNQSVKRPVSIPTADLAVLKMEFAACDKKALVADTSSLFAEKKVRCQLCKCQLQSASNFVDHVASKGHIAATTEGGGKVCGDALDFWIERIREANIVATNGASDKVVISADCNQFI